MSASLAPRASLRSSSNAARGCAISVATFRRTTSSTIVRVLPVGSGDLSLTYGLIIFGASARTVLDISAAWFCGSPGGHAVFDEIDCAGLCISASLKRERHQARVRNDKVFIVHGELSLMSSGSSGGDGQRLTTPISYRVRNYEINEIVDEAHTNIYVGPLGRVIGGES